MCVCVYVCALSGQQKRQDRGRKDLQYKTLKKQERFEDAQKLEGLLEAIKVTLEAETENLASQAKGASVVPLPTRANDLPGDSCMALLTVSLGSMAPPLLTHTLMTFF